MHRFNFKLSSLLDFREYLEQLARKETALAYKDVKESGRAIKELKQRYKKTTRALDKKVFNGINSVQLQLFTRYLAAVDHGIVEEKLREKEFKRKLDERIARLTEKSIDKKVLEQLKGKKEMEYMEEFRKSEQEIIDEIVSLKKARELNRDRTSEN